MGSLTVLVLITLGIWLWRKRRETRKDVAQSTEGNLLETIRNDPSYQEYAEKFSKLFGDSFDTLFGAAKKLHEVYKEEDDVFQKNLAGLKASTEPFPFPFPRQITLLDELDALIADTRRALNALTPPQPRRLMHSEYAGSVIILRRQRFEDFHALALTTSQVHPCSAFPPSSSH